MKTIEMVDLHGQYLEIKDEVDAAIQSVLDRTDFIRGSACAEFEDELASFLGGHFCVGVGNGTDALQIAMMAAGVGPGDEVITTPFTFVATAEAAALLGANPVFVDIDPHTFNIDPTLIESGISSRTRAIVPVHLFGQPAEMEAIMGVARRHGIAVIEDNAQSIGSRYSDAGTGYIGDMGCLSFFPSKNLGAFGDGGAVLTNDEGLHERVRMISNHGSKQKYHNEIIGVNSRLDTLQAAVLRVKLRYLRDYELRRREAADRYDDLLSGIAEVVLPQRAAGRTHVFHQYTIRIKIGVDARDRLAAHLRDRGLPSAVYYPVPLHQLEVFSGSRRSGSLQHSEQAAAEVLSLPMHTQLTVDQQELITSEIRRFFHA